MNLATQLKKIKAMPDSDLKLSKLETVGLKAFPNGSIQQEVRRESSRLRAAGFKIPIPEKYQPKQTTQLGGQFGPEPTEIKHKQKVETSVEKARVKKQRAQEMAQKHIRPNPFEGADDIYTTKNKIAVTKTKNKRTKRGFTKTTQTKYYEQNDSNLKLLKKAQGDAVRSGRKGTQIKRI